MPRSATTTIATPQMDALAQAKREWAQKCRRIARRIEDGQSRPDQIAALFPDAAAILLEMQRRDFIQIIGGICILTSAYSTWVLSLDKDANHKPSEIAADKSAKWAAQFKRIAQAIQSGIADQAEISGLFPDAAKIAREAESQGLIKLSPTGTYVLSDEYVFSARRDRALRCARKKGAATEGKEIRPFRDQHMIATATQIDGQAVKKEIPGLTWFIAHNKLSDAEIAAAIKLVDWWECAGGGGVRAVNPMRPIVDTSARAFDGIDRLDAGQALRQARYLVGIGLWPLIEAVVIRNLPIRDIEDTHGLPAKRGMVQFAVQKGLQNLAAALSRDEVLA